MQTFRLVFGASILIIGAVNFQLGGYLPAVLCAASGGFNLGMAFAVWAFQKDYHDANLHNRG